MASWLCATCRRTVELRTDALGRLWERCHCGTRRLQPLPNTPILYVTITATALPTAPGKYVPPPNGRRAFDSTGWTWAREPRICANPACRKPFMGRRGVNAQCCSQSCRWRVYYRTRTANRLKGL